MNSINVNIPVVNMPQVSQHMPDAHRVPMVHQAQNADLARDRIDLQARSAQEAEQAENKIVDPKDRREEEKRRSKKRQGEQNDGNGEGNGETASAVAVSMTDSGRLIDLEA